MGNNVYLMSWRPFETAPKTGEQFLVCFQNVVSDYYIVKWVSGEEYRSQLIDFFKKEFTNYDDKEIDEILNTRNLRTDFNGGFMSVDYVMEFLDLGNPPTYWMPIPPLPMTKESELMH